MSCDCPNPSPSPQDPCVSPYSGNLNCVGGNTNIKMYLGEKFNDSSSPPSLKIFSASTEDFIIEYSAKELFDAKVLSTGGVWANTDNGWYTFNLTEQELISTANYETWVAFGNIQASCGNTNTFYAQVLYNLNIDINGLASSAAEILNSYIQDNKQINISSLMKLITKLSVTIYEDSIEKQEKIKVAYDWIKNIYDNFYGKKFLIRLGESNNLGDYKAFSGICVKQLKDHSTPDRDFPYFIDGDGSSQGYYLSDVISSEGGWPNRDTTSVLGLPLSSDALRYFITDDGKIDCFIKFGTVYEDGNLKVYEKFGREFVVDFSRLNPDSYTTHTIGNKQILYVKASVSNRIYFDDDGQWALVTLNDLVPLINKYPEDEWARSSTSNSFLNYLSASNSKIKKVVDALIGFSSGVQNNGSAIYNFGARDGLTIFNTFDGHLISYFPRGAVVPLKSNIFSYGPYYHDASSPEDGKGGGGVDVERNESLVPWNFIPPDSTGNIDVAQAYDNMDCVGSALARDGAKGLQKLEKGSVSVVGLPEYTIGYSVAGGPTVLTDISVDYGSNGFRTSYNFSTYSPRFGRPAKYILDSWQDTIKRVNFTNNYLREERNRLQNLNNTLKRNTIDAKLKRGLDTTGRNSKRTKNINSPGKILISGYYLSLALNGDQTPYNNSRDGTIDLSTFQSATKKCDACSHPSPSPGCFPVPSVPMGPPPSDGPYRIYSFAETHEAYQEDYIQSSYNQLCIMSLDGFFSPVSLAGDNHYQHSRLPRFAMRLNEDGTFVEWSQSDIINNKEEPGYHPLTKTRDEMPPFQICGSSYAYTLPIHQQYLNPITSAKLLENWDDRKNNSLSGFVISSIAFGNSFTDYQLSFTDSEESARQDSTNFRFSSLRGPLVLHGWGYDTSGKPIPNSNDVPKQTERGKFRRDKLTDKFMDDWLQNPRSWPVGPIDLRFDRERGVWTCPSPNKIIVARLLESLNPFSRAAAELINPEAGGVKFYQDHHISGPNGEDIRSDISKAQITVYDFLGISKPLCKCDVVYAYWDSNRYIVLETSRTYKNIPDCDPCTTTTTVRTTATPTIATPSPSPSVSPSLSVTPSLSISPSVSTVPSPSISPSLSISPSVSTVPSPSISPSVSTVPSPSISVSASIEISPSASLEISPSASIPPSVSIEISASPQASPYPSASVCWVGLDVLKTIKNYNKCKTQALIHRDGCLEWEDIVECDPIKNFEAKQKQQKCEEQNHSQFNG